MLIDGVGALRKVKTALALIWLCASVDALTVPAYAQTATALQEISAVDILVHQLTEEARRCNVSEAGIETAIRSTLSSSRLRLDHNASPRIYVHVDARLVSDGGELCVASISVELQRTMAIPGTSQVLSGVAVWTATSLMTAPSVSLGELVNQQINDYTTRLIADWMKANPR